MSADKYPSIFSRQMEAIVYLFFVQLSFNRQSFALFTHPLTISPRKFISVHFKMARKVTVSRFNCVF